MEKLIPDTRNAELKTRNPEPETPNSKPETENERLFVQVAVLSQVVALLSVFVGLIFIGWLEYPDFFTKKTIEPVAAVEVIDEDKVENGMDVASGFIAEGAYLMVKQTCTACHSGKLVTQNRASREGWLDMIRWMQATQKLWDLGQNEDKILDYLAKYYGPQKKGRRAPAEVEEWYMIE